MIFGLPVINRVFEIIQLSRNSGEHRPHRQNTLHNTLSPPATSWKDWSESIVGKAQVDEPARASQHEPQGLKPPARPLTDNLVSNGWMDGCTAFFSHQRS